MNHILRLQKERDQLTENYQTMIDGLDHIKSYLESPKFTSEDINTVNPGDILMRIQEIKFACLHPSDIVNR